MKINQPNFAKLPLNKAAQEKRADKQSKLGSESSLSDMEFLSQKKLNPGKADTKASEVKMEAPAKALENIGKAQVGLNNKAIDKKEDTLSDIPAKGPRPPALASLEEQVQALFGRGLTEQDHIIAYSVQDTIMEALTRNPRAFANTMHSLQRLGYISPEESQALISLHTASHPDFISPPVCAHPYLDLTSPYEGRLSDNVLSRLRDAAYLEGFYWDNELTHLQRDGLINSEQRSQLQQSYEEIRARPRYGWEWYE